MTPRHEDDREEHPAAVAASKALWQARKLQGQNPFAVRDEWKNQIKQFCALVESGELNVNAVIDWLENTRRTTFRPRIYL